MSKTLCVVCRKGLRKSSKNDDYKEKQIHRKCNKQYLTNPSYYRQIKYCPDFDYSINDHNKYYNNKVLP